MIIAGTGHRPDKLGGYTDQVFHKITDVCISWFLENNHWLGNKHLVEKVITGMAIGFDQALAVAAIKMNIPVLAAIPFLGQEKKWPLDGQQFYHKILDKCKEVKVISEGDYAPYKMQIRNKWMVNNCDMVLALWDGSSGGTGNCIKYAEEHNKPINNLWDEFKSY